MSAIKGRAQVVETVDQESKSEPETDLDDYESLSDSPTSDLRSEYRMSQALELPQAIIAI